MITYFLYKILDIDYVITDTFGYRQWRAKKYGKNNAQHNGIDFSCPVGSILRSPMAGKVISVGNDLKSNSGKSIKIDHGGGFVTYYAHLQSQIVTVGQTVLGGERIGNTGNTGKSTGPHLHLGVIVNGNFVNPQHFLNKAATPYEVDIRQSETEFFDKPEPLKESGTRLAAGIWQIVKLNIDTSIVKRRISDSSISMNQGSLLNYANKVCQQPFVEFFGDTYGDQYHFIARKPPFDLSGYSSLFTLTIDHNNVISESLGFNNDEIYSWYQLLPFAGLFESNVQTQYMPAIFFPEYAEVWGSKPLVVQSNYYDRQKFNEQDSDTILENCFKDLKFIIETHCYLPFTRKGVIVINQDRRIKRGMGIRYTATGEIYYVDSVAHSYNVTETETSRFTTLYVSRGMVEKYINGIEFDGTVYSYFNIVNFGEKFKQIKTTNTDWSKTISFDVKFDYESYYLITNSIESPTQEDIELRVENPLYETDTAFSNGNYINSIVSFLNHNLGQKIKLVGYCDSTESNKLSLSTLRAETVRFVITGNYFDKYGEDITSRIEVEGKQDFTSMSDNDSFLGRALNRRVEAEFMEIQTKTEEKKEKILSNKNWKVNKNVFEFFMKRGQE